MKKEFRVNAIYPDSPEGLTLLLRASSLNGAVKKLRQNPAFHEDDLIVSLVTAHGLKYPDLPNRLQSKAVVVTNAKELKI